MSLVDQVLSVVLTRSSSKENPTSHKLSENIDKIKQKIADNDKEILKLGEKLKAQDKLIQRLEGNDTHRVCLDPKTRAKRIKFNQTGYDITHSKLQKLLEKDDKYQTQLKKLPL
ncbi:hypothetical protein EJ063_07665 [Vibrio aquaticus]|uniref:Uncharacterized protein n=1 Tax=Vibrio aquaticus TaxID=2496559 RepID=A0A3S0MPH1_9VIBR|nr:hypothetical protein [Vibrio aquaticus]RTZ16661.1 hypothetical protein EJ063_07665 [Vibrio aquaticus]